MPTRADAWQLLCTYTLNENLRRHARCVEACLRHYARKFQQDEELWGITGLLHDFDYERWPNHEHSPTNGHPIEGARILRQQGYPEEVIHAILAHADYTGVPRTSLLDHALFACDELSGFLVACALVKPTRSVHEVDVASVKRKMKDKAFARAVSREDLVRGAQELGLPLDEHIAHCLEALRGVASALGLDGQASSGAD